MMAVLLIAALASFNSISLSNSAEIRSGAKCTKFGKKANLGNLKFECVRKNGKLSWREVKPKVVAQASLPEFWPLDKPVKVQDLVLIADASVRKYTVDANALPKINLMTGPRTNKVNAERYITWLNNAAKSWSKDWLPQEVDVAIASFEDFEWMSEKWPKYGLTGPYFDDSRESWNRAGRDCNHGSAIGYPKPFFWGCLPVNLGRGIGLDKFAPHEYTHLAQYGILNSRTTQFYGGLPLLFSEGSADFYGITFASNRDDVANNWMDFWIKGYFNNDAKADLRQASVERIEEILNDSMRFGKIAPGHWYWSGAYATARLVAAKGHSSFVEYIRKTGEFRNPFKAFELEYGMSFESFAKIIAPEVKSLAGLLQR